MAVCKIYYTFPLIACQRWHTISTCIWRQSFTFCHFSAHFSTDGIHPHWYLKIQQTVFALKGMKQKNKAIPSPAPVNLFLYKLKVAVNQPCRIILAHLGWVLYIFWRVNKMSSFFIIINHHVEVWTSRFCASAVKFSGQFCLLSPVPCPLWNLISSPWQLLKLFQTPLYILLPVIQDGIVQPLLRQCSHWGQ